ncbi:MAG: mechanosensitive ion channel, partial [Planctomycetales bacterium]
AYDAQGELPRLRIDAATAQVKQLEQVSRRLLEIVTEVRKKDSAAQKEDAEAAWRDAPRVFKPHAQVAIDFADRRFALANDIQVAAAKQRRVGRQLTRWKDDFVRTQKWTEVVNSSKLGLMLFEKRSALPSRLQLLRSLADGEDKLAAFQKELYELEDRRADLSDVDAAVNAELARLRAQGIQPPADAAQAMRDLFARETLILDSLLGDATRNYNLRIGSREDQRELSRVARDYREFIGARIFWVRSAPPLTLADVSLAGDALTWLMNAESRREMAGVLTARVQSYPLRAILLGSGVVLLILLRPRIRARLRTQGELAASLSCESIQPTLHALLLTALLSAPFPLAVWSLGWGMNGASSELIRAVSAALSNVALGLLALEFVRHLCLSQGLAAAHFRWPIPSVSVMRSVLRLLLLGGLPLAFLSVVLEYQDNPVHQASLGRLCMIALFLLLAFSLYRLTSPTAGMFAETMEQNPGDWLNRLRTVWRPLTVLTPVAFALLSMLGFQYTAFRLGIDLGRALQLVLLLWVLGAVLFLWVRVKRRRLRRRQELEARQRDANEDDSETGDLDAIVAREEEVDLVEMDHQIQTLIRGLLVSAGLLGLSVIWIEDLAAVKPLVEARLWEVAGPGGEATPITVGSVLLAALIFALSLSASRNIPGLVDVMLLGRLSVESSMRYAISTLSQYGITIVGVLAACHFVGVTWDKAQWLVTALSVGLGFGLQEVVAKFVCGILLLFERPIRVGDVVTLGDTTGVVVRIRSRATTVRNWDRQEVVIPNKELITGRIVNWTLSDQLNRVVVNVGVAYGSDAERVRDVLQRIGEDNLNVQDDPRPVALFERFGDSTLDFALRVYLDDVDQRTETIDQLHTAVHRRFAEEGIEIAVPQHDLHLRSVAPSARLPLDDAEPASSSSEESGS